MPLQRVLSIFILSFIAALTIGCGNSSNDNVELNQSFQNFDAPVRLSFLNVAQRAAGTTFAPIRVGILDHNGRIVTTDNRAVTIALSNPAGATLSGTTTVNAVNGVATFGDLSVDRVGDYTFVASAEGLIGAESNAFDISGAAPNQLTFITQPPPLPAPGENPGPGTSQAKGQTFDPPLRVEVRDQFGNLVTNDSTVTIVVAVNAAGTTTLGGTTNVPTVNGVATFTDLTVQSGGGVVVLAAVSGQGLAVSNPFFVPSPLFAYAASVPNLPTGVAVPPSFGPSSQLFRANALAATLTPVPVGQITGIQNVSGLVPHPDGRLLGTSNDGGVASLFSIDNPTTSAAPTMIGPITGNGTDGTTVTGLTIDAGNRVVYAFISNGTNPGLYRINPDTGAATFVGAPGLAGTGAGLAFDGFANPGVIFSTNSVRDSLVTLDPATGAATEIADSVGVVTAAVSGLGVNPFNTTLLGLFGVGLGSNLAVIDKATGQTATPTSLPGITAATFRVEEPPVAP